MMGMKDPTNESAVPNFVTSTEKWHVGRTTGDGDRIPLSFGAPLAMSPVAMAQIAFEATPPPPREPLPKVHDQRAKTAEARYVTAADMPSLSALSGWKHRQEAGSVMSSKESQIFAQPSFDQSDTLMLPDGMATSVHGDSRSVSAA